MNLGIVTSQLGSIIVGCRDRTARRLASLCGGAADGPEDLLDFGAAGSPVKLLLDESFAAGEPLLFVLMLHDYQFSNAMGQVRVKG